MDFLGIDIGCAIRSLRDGKFPEKDCLLTLISKLLGYFVIALSTTVKLPQILKILKHRNATGISAAGIELQIVGYTIGLGYCIHKGLPFSAYGELTFLLIQALVLIAIIYYYSQPIGNTTWIRALLHASMSYLSLLGSHKYGRTLKWFHGESFYEHPRKSSNKCYYGRYKGSLAQWCSPESDHHIPKASRQER